MRDPQHRHHHRPPVAHRAIDLGDQPRLAGAGVDDRRVTAQAAGDADHRVDRPDRDLVAAGHAARPVELVAVDPGAVAAAQVLDLDHVAGAPHPGVQPRHAGVVDRDHRPAGAAERDVHPIVEVDDRRAAVRQVDVDHQEGAWGVDWGQRGPDQIGGELSRHAVRPVHSGGRDDKSPVEIQVVELR